MKFLVFKQIEMGDGMTNVYVTISAALLLAGCGQVDTKSEQAAKRVSPTSAAPADPSTVDVAAGVAATPAPEPTATQVEKTGAPNETLNCSGGPGSFTLVVSDFETYQMATGATQAIASYRIRGDNPFTDMRASGSVEVNADGYEFPNGMTLYDGDDNSMAFFFPDSGDIIECIRS